MIQKIILKCVLLLLGLIGFPGGVWADGLPPWLNSAMRGPAVAALRSTMDADALAGQVLLVHLRWAARGEDATVLAPDQREMLARVQPGGVALYAQNLGDEASVRRLIAEIRALCRIEPFIALDEEGGRVSRLAKARGLGYPKTPSAAELAAGGPDSVAAAYADMARRLSGLGFTMNFAPVADLAFPTSADLIGDRSFGADPDVVAACAVAAMKALHAEGIVAVAKHWPGHGRASGDTHFRLAAVEEGWDVLAATDLVPFRRLTQEGLAALMTAHVSYPRIDASGKPVSLSAELIGGKLRGAEGFRGLVITDALDMQGVEKAASADRLELESLRAGADMLLSPVDPIEARDVIAAAVKDGSLPIARLNEATLRVLETKARFGLLAPRK